MSELLLSFCWEACAWECGVSMSFSGCTCYLLFCNSWALCLVFGPSSIPWISTLPYCFPASLPVSPSTCFPLHFSLELFRATALQMLPAIFFSVSSVCIFPSAPPPRVLHGTPHRTLRPWDTEGTAQLSLLSCLGKGQSRRAKQAAAAASHST